MSPEPGMPVNPGRPFNSRPRPRQKPDGRRVRAFKQAAGRSWSEQLTDRERERLDAYLREREDERVPSEVMLLGELASLYGWQAMRDVLEDEVSYQLMLDLLRAGREIQKRNRLQRLVDTYMAVAAGFGGKKGNKSFKKYLREVKRGTA